jgi:hypothetical protein
MLQPDEITVAFDEERLVADAGLLLRATLAVGLGCASCSMPTSTWARRPGGQASPTRR